MLSNAHPRSGASQAEGSVLIKKNINILKVKSAFRDLRYILLDYRYLVSLVYRCTWLAWVLVDPAKAWRSLDHERLDCSLGKPQSPCPNINICNFTTCRHWISTGTLGTRSRSHTTARMTNRSISPSGVHDEACIDSSNMPQQPFDGRAAPKAIRSYHFKIQVLQSEGAEKVRTWTLAVLSKLFCSQAPPFPFQSQVHVDQTFADEAFPFWSWGTCHGLLVSRSRRRL